MANMINCKQRIDGLVEFCLNDRDDLVSCKVRYRTGTGEWRPAALYRSTEVGYMIDRGSWRHWNDALFKGIVQFGKEERDYIFYWNKFINIRNYCGNAELKFDILCENGVFYETAVMLIEDGPAVYLDRWTDYAGANATADEKQVEEGKWLVTKGSNGCDTLSVKCGTVLPEISIRTGVEGTYDVYVCLGGGVTNLHIRAGECGFRSKFITGGDFMSLYNTNFKDKAYREIRWKSVDFKADTRIYISQISNSDRVLDFGSIAYIKLVPCECPVNREKDAVWKSDIVLYFEPYSYAATMGMTCPAAVCEVMEDFARLEPEEITCQVVRIGSRAMYHSNVVERLERDTLNIDDLKVYHGGPEMVRNMDVLKVACEYCSRRGLFFTANLGVNRPYLGLGDWTNCFTDRFVLNNMDRVRNGYLDYTYREVMDYAVAIVEEIVQNYDINGISLDFMRTEENQTADTLVEFIGRIRAVLAQKKPVICRDGRMRLSVRIPAERVEYYKAAETWVKRELVDIIIPSNIGEVFPLPAVEHYLRLCRGSRTKVYGCIDGWKKNFNLNNVTGSIDAVVSPDEIRDIVDYYRKLGTDGIFFYQGDVYAFNLLVTRNIFLSDNSGSIDTK